MKSTTNYGLNKPELTDLPDITVLSTNFDKIDENLKSVSDRVSTTETNLSGKAPTSHASTATTYGAGTSSNYGHVKLSDSTSSTSSTSSGVAATPKAVKSAYDLANTAKTTADSKLPLGGGNVTGSLTVQNKNVVRSVNGTAADDDGNVTLNVGSDYTLPKATSTVLGGVTIGSNISVSSGKISLSKNNVTNALGYTPLQTAVKSINGQTGDVTLDLGGDVQSVDGVEADSNGNVALNASTREEILKAASRVTDVEVDPAIAQVQALQTSVARLESEFVEQMDNISNQFNTFANNTVPELSAAPIIVSATPENGVNYEYVMTTNGLVNVSCGAGCGYNSTTTGGGEEDYTTTYWKDGNTTFSVTVKGMVAYPSKTVSQANQSWSGNFFLKKGQKIVVYCSRSYKYSPDPHWFNATIYPHVLTGE